MFCRSPPGSLRPTVVNTVGANYPVFSPSPHLARVMEGVNRFKTVFKDGQVAGIPVRKEDVVLLDQPAAGQPLAKPLLHLIRIARIFLCRGWRKLTESDRLSVLLLLSSVEMSDANVCEPGLFPVSS